MMQESGTLTYFIRETMYTVVALCSVECGGVFLVAWRLVVRR